MELIGDHKIKLIRGCSVNLRMGFTRGINEVSAAASLARTRPDTPRNVDIKIPWQSRCRAGCRLRELNDF